MPPSLSRREFLRSSGAAGLGVATVGWSRVVPAQANSKLRVLSIGVVGTIGAKDRKTIAEHPWGVWV